MNNPKAALDALNAVGETVGKITLSEITLGKAAILDRIKSPLVTGKNMKDISLDDVIPTLFVLASSAMESRKLLAKNEFEEASIAWGDSVPLADGLQLLDGLKRIASRLDKVAPSGMVSGDGAEVKGDDQKKTTTAG